MPTPKVLILTGDAAESLEVMYPYQRLREEGYEEHIAAPSKKKLHFVVDDFEPGNDIHTELPMSILANMPRWCCRAAGLLSTSATTQTACESFGTSSRRRNPSHSFATLRWR